MGTLASATSAAKGYEPAGNFARRHDGDLAQPVMASSSVYRLCAAWRQGGDSFGGEDIAVASQILARRLQRPKTRPSRWGCLAAGVAGVGKTAGGRLIEFDTLEPIERR
jgi:hypothetical protein